MNRNKSFFLNSLKGAFTVCFAIFLCNAGMYGQGTSHENTNTNIISMLGELSGGTPGRGFACSQFFKDTAGKKHIHFKKIIMTGYGAHDSSFAQKRYMGRNIWLFNKHGLETAFITYDSLGVTADSISADYNKNDSLTGWKKYGRPDSDKALKMVSSEVIIRDAQGHVTEDSTWRKAADYLSIGKMGFSVEVEKFDSKGNCISRLAVSKKDTESFYTYQYNDKNMMISRKNNVAPITNEYLKYDDSLNMTEDINYGYDTSREEYTYNKQNRILTDMEYNGNTLKKKTVYTYNPDGSHTQEMDEYSAPEGVATCEKEEKTTIVFDRYLNKVSIVVTTTQGDISSTESEIHKYTYTAGGKIISDTERTTETAQWHISKALKVQNNKYDAHENLLEQVSRGKQGVDENHKLTYTYNDKDQVLETAFYNDCDGAPFGSQVNTYYPDGMTLKEQKTKMGSYGCSDVMCGKDSRLLSFTIVYSGNGMQGTIDYEE